MSPRLKGYALGIVAAATYGMNPLFALPLYSAGMTADSVLFFRYAMAIPLLAAMTAMRGRSFRVNRRQLLTLLILGMLMALSSLSLFLSYNYMDAGIASTILFVYPVMVAVIMAAVFRERLSPVMTASIALALGGIALLYRNGGGEALSLPGTLLALASALTYAIYIVAVNRSSLKYVPTLTVTFYLLLFGVMLFAGRLLLSGEIQTPPSDRWWLWGCVVCLAVFPTALSFVCTTGAIHYIGSTPTAILGALEPVTAVIIGVSVFGERLTPREIIGLVAIITAVTAVVAAPRMSLRLASVRRMFPKIDRNRRHK